MVSHPTPSIFHRLERHYPRRFDPGDLQGAAEGLLGHLVCYIFPYLSQLHNLEESITGVYIYIYIYNAVSSTCICKDMCICVSIYIYMKSNVTPRNVCSPIPSTHVSCAFSRSQLPGMIWTPSWEPKKVNIPLHLLVFFHDKHIMIVIIDLKKKKKNISEIYHLLDKHIMIVIMII